MNTSQILKIAYYNLLFVLIPAISYSINFTPQLHLTETYTDNLLLTDTHREHDFITTVSPEFLFEIPGRRSRVNVRYEPSYSIYDRFSEYNTWRHSAQLSGSTDLSKTTSIVIEDTVLRTEDPVQEVDTTLRRNRQPYLTNSASLQLTNQFGEADRILVTFDHGLLNNNDPEVEDNQSYETSVELIKRLTSDIDMETTGALTRGEYDVSDNFNHWEAVIRINKRLRHYLDIYVQYSHAVRDYQGLSENYMIYEPSIGLSSSLNEETQISIGVGYFIQDWDYSKDEKLMTVNSDVQLRWDLRRGSLGFNGSSGFEQQDFGAEQLGVDFYHSAGISGEYDLYRNFRCEVSGSFRRDEYIYANPNRIDMLFLVSTGFQYQMNDWLSARLNYSFRKRTSTVVSTGNDNEYQENRVFLAISLARARSRTDRQPVANE